MDSVNGDPGKKKKKELPTQCERARQYIYAYAYGFVNKKLRVDGAIVAERRVTDGGCCLRVRLVIWCYIRLLASQSTHGGLDLY